MTKCLWLSGFALWLLPGAAVELIAQGTPASAAAIARSLRKDGHPGNAVAILTEAATSARDRDAVADSLAAVAIDLAGTDTKSSRARSLASAALQMAAVGESGVVGKSRGVPYSGALTRLRLIAVTANDMGIRASSMQALNDLDKTADLTAFFRAVATSRSPVAYVAVDLLSEKRGSAGKTIARTLYKNNEVTEEYAKEILAHKAAIFGWK